MIGSPLGWNVDRPDRIHIPYGNSYITLHTYMIDLFIQERAFANRYPGRSVRLVVSFCCCLSFAIGQRFLYRINQRACGKREHAVTIEV